MAVVWVCVVAFRCVWLGVILATSIFLPSDSVQDLSSPVHELLAIICLRLECVHMHRGPSFSVPLQSF